MNYLGHLFFSNGDHQLMMANLFGDFVKGKDYTDLPDIIQKGVKLHREIDDFIDHHPEITKLRIHLYAKLPKIAGIAIDLYMDHILAKKWNNYSSVDLESFVNGFFEFALNPENQFIRERNKVYRYPKRYLDLLQLMNERNWILRYRQMEGLKMASSGLSKRISFQNELHLAPKVFIEEEKLIQSVFERFMTDAQHYFDNYVR